MGNCCGTYGLQDLPENQFMTSNEAADYLKMHIKTVCRLAKEGKIPAEKIGSEWRFPRSKLNEWLAKVLI